MKVLELFAGTRSIGKVFEARGHEVFSVEWDKSFENINLYEDISKLTADRVLELFGHPDVVWASPDCFPAGTLVWTKSGYKNVEDIRCFDEVLTHKNRYRKVYATMRTNKYDIYKVKISGCEEVLVSSEHPYLVRKKYRDNHRKSNTYARTLLSAPEWIKVKDLSKNYKVGIPINTNSIIPNYAGCIYAVHNSYGMNSSHIENTLGKRINNPDFWWIVGNYFGNGSLSTNKSSIDIACNPYRDDAQVVSDKLSNLGVKHSIYSKKTAKHVCISSKEWCCFLAQFGVGALNKQITPLILDLPKFLLSAFLDGYLAADGHSDINDVGTKTYTVTTISRNLAYGLQMCLLKAWGVYASMITRKNQTNVIAGRTVNVHTPYTLSFFEKQREVGSKYFIEDDICWVNITDIEKLPSQQTTVYNFSVEDDESYTANNIIVHNCSSYSVAGIGHNRSKNTVTGNLDPKTDYAKFCDNVNQHVIELIKELNPTYWFIENPRGGLRKMSWMQGLPRYTISYCQYGDNRQKPTDIWTNHPNPQFKPLCKLGAKCHVAAPRGSRTGTQGLKNSKERSVIPPSLCEHIVDICEGKEITDVPKPNYLFELPLKLL